VSGLLPPGRRPLGVDPQDGRVDRHQREAALIALRLVQAGNWTDEELAEAFGSLERAADATSHLAGFLMQLLAIHRGESTRATVHFVRHLLTRGDEPPSAPALAHR
jgi:hypothetical protein